MRGLVRHRLIKVAAIIRRRWGLPLGVNRINQEKLDLRMDVAGETIARGRGQLSAQHLAGVSKGGLPVRHGDVAEHAGNAAVRAVLLKGHQLER